MQVWVKVNNDSDKIYKALSIGLTTNVVGPFLSPDNNLNASSLLGKYENIKLWDDSTNFASDFNSLELLAAKHAYNKNLGSIITLACHGLDFSIIHEVKSITDNNFVLKILGAEDLSSFCFINLLNMNINYILFDNSRSILDNKDEEKYNRFIEIRNQSMKRTRLGLDFTLWDKELNKTLFAISPDFILSNIDIYQ